MRPLAALLAALAAAAAAPRAAPAACAAVTAPSPCGQASDSPERCAFKGCCYDAARAYPCFYPGADAAPITHVHVVQASHFDAGFAYTIAGVLNLWWYTHFPRAFALGTALAASNPNAVGLHFTAQCWLVDMFLHCPPGVAGLACPTTAQVAQLNASVAAGWLTWHAFPFNSEAELHSPDLLAAGVAACHALDDAYGFPRKATFSQRDVPGTTRAVGAQLLAAGVTALSIGVNGASTPPFVPRAFNWLDAASGRSIFAMVHPYGYGGTGAEDAVLVPGLGHAMVTAWRGDNAGPPESVAEIEGDFKNVRAEFPGAAVFASTFDNFTAAVLASPAALAALPTLTSEMGDTWIHGAPSEPVRLGFLRRADALRSECLASGACDAADPRVANMTRFLLKCAEHTWGTDIKSFLHDTTHWTNAELEAQLAARAPNFMATLATWVEQRAWCVDYTIGALAGHALQPALAAALADLRPAAPPAPAAEGFAPFAPGAVWRGARWSVGFDGATGALSTLADAATGRAWAAPADGTRLAWLHYVTLSAADYDVFTGPEPGGYYPFDGKDEPEWFRLDFGKPNVSSAAPVHQEVAQTLKSLWLREGADAASFLVEAAFADELHSYYGAPASVWLQFDVPRGAGGAINASVSIFNKTATRLPEGLFLRFNASARGGWRVSKLGADVDPFDVVPGGAHHNHGFAGPRGGVAALDAGARLGVRSDSAGVAGFGNPTPLPAPVWANSTDPAEGAAFMLVANGWGTNYRACTGGAGGCRSATARAGPATRAPL